MTNIINPYRYAAAGGGGGDEPEILVKNDSDVEIPSGNSHTITPNPNELESTTEVFTVENTGDATLTITSIDFSNESNISGSITCIFDSSYDDTSTISASGSDTLTVTYTPASDGSFGWDMEINNDDSDENPYEISATGTADSDPQYVEITVDSGSVYSGTGANANYKFWTVTGDTGFTVTNAGNSSGSEHIEFLLISGGGGGGGAYAGGGGGAGELKEVTGSSHSAVEGDYDVYPGIGGAAAVTSTQGSQGEDTQIYQGLSQIYYAEGGGGGGSFSMTTGQYAGGSGASGGGGGVTNAYSGPPGGGSGYAGYNGATGGYRIGSTYRGGGGGGGAGGAGYLGSTLIGGAGGNGVSSTYWNPDAYTEWYAGGGGGWAHLSRPGGSGGSGIGGNGGTGASSNSGGTAGTVNTGSGGGGDVHGYAGGSGMVVVRWKYQN